MIDRNDDVVAIVLFHESGRKQYLLTLRRDVERMTTLLTSNDPALGLSMQVNPRIGAETMSPERADAMGAE